MKINPKAKTYYTDDVYFDLCHCPSMFNPEECLIDPKEIQKVKDALKTFHSYVGAIKQSHMIKTERTIGRHDV